MSTPNEAPDSVQDVASSIFSDASNPAVEQAISEPTPTETDSSSESVIPAVSDFKVPEVAPLNVDTVEQTPAEVVAPTEAPKAQVSPVVPAAPVQNQPTPEQLMQFQAWQQAQQQAPPIQQPVQQQRPQQPAQQSQEEIDKALNKYTVTPDKFNALFTEEDPVKAAGMLNEMLQGAVIQAVTMANHLIQDSTGKIAQQVQPYMSFADSQRELMLRDQFFQQNQDLKGQDLLIQTVMGQMDQERRAGVYRPANDQQVFSDVATRTKALIASMQQQGQPVPQPAVQQGLAPQGKPRMAVLPSGGGGGSISAAPSAAANGDSQAARSIFG